jgi:hypothetical protein
MVSTWRTPMPFPEKFVASNWQYAEKLYLRELATQEARKEFSELSHSKKKETIRNFFKKNAVQTKEGKEATKLLMRLLPD